MNPSTADLLARRRVARRRRSDRPPEQLERRPRRRAGRRDRRQPVRGRSDDVDPGRARGDGRLRRLAHRRRERGARCARRSQRVATGEVTIASRDVQLNGIAIAKGDWLGLADGEPVAGGADFDDVAYAVVERAAARAAGAADAARRAGRGRSSTACSPGSPQAHPELEVDVHEGGQPHYRLLLVGRVESATDHGAADPDPPRRGQRGLPRGARAAARHARRHRGRRVRRRRQRSGRRGRASTRRTSC